MFCRYCGKKIADDMRYCNYCGERVAAAERITAKEPQPSIFFNLLGIAVSVLCLWCSYFYFDLADETRHSFNGFSVQKVPEFVAYGGVLLAIGVGIGIASICNWHKKRNKNGVLQRLDTVRTGDRIPEQWYLWGQEGAYCKQYTDDAEDQKRGSGMATAWLSVPQQLPLQQKNRGC